MQNALKIFFTKNWLNNREREISQVHSFQVEWLPIPIFELKHKAYISMYIIFSFFLSYSLVRAIAFNAHACQVVFHSLQRIEKKIRISSVLTIDLEQCHFQIKSVGF